MRANETILCACGCGGTRLRWDKRGIERKFLYHHHDNRHFKHGHKVGNKTSPTLQSWESMLRRCYNPKAAGYDNYGARGIVVCERWRNSFPNFLEDMGIRPDGKWIGRIDNDGNYEPRNCRWETPKEQMNNMRANKRVEHLGRSMNLCQWCDVVGIKYKTLWSRLERLGWSIEDALTRSVQDCGRKSLETRRK
jgi:hypothetical protein